MAQSRLSLAVAGFVIEGVFDSPIAVDSLRMPFLAASPAQGQVRVREYRPGRKLCYPSSGIKVEGRDDWDIVQLPDGSVGCLRRSQQGQVRMLVSFGSSSMDIELLYSLLGDEPENAHIRDFAYPLRFPAMVLLAQAAGVLLHGCSVKGNGRGWLFLGRPGVGKTTMGRLWEQSGKGVVLNDEYSAVRVIEDNVWVFGTPWLGSGRLCKADRAPLERVFFLEHGDRNCLVPLGPSEAFSRLWGQLYLPLWDRVAMEATIDTVASLVQTCSFYSLGFVPNLEVVDFLISQ